MTSEQRDALLRANLLTVQTALNALALLLDTPSDDDLEPEPCGHENRQNVAMFGEATRWRCRDCGHEEGSDVASAERD